jgi:hypothetical protein
MPIKSHHARPRRENWRSTAHLMDALRQSPAFRTADGNLPSDHALLQAILREARKLADRKLLDERFMRIGKSPSKRGHFVTQFRISIVEQGAAKTG